jgi:hypothetical protein
MNDRILHPKQAQAITRVVRYLSCAEGLPAPIERALVSLGTEDHGESEVEILDHQLGALEAIVDFLWNDEKLSYEFLFTKEASRRFTTDAVLELQADHIFNTLLELRQIASGYLERFPKYQLPPRAGGLSNRY